MPKATRTTRPAWVRSTERGNFPPIREDNERTKEETKARRCVDPCGTVLHLIGFRHCFGRARVHAKPRRSIS